MRILLSAFEPYGTWKSNASWDALIAFLSERGASPTIMTRRYPVELATLRTRLAADLAQGVDAVLHVGQSPGTSEIQLESIAVNVAGVDMLPSGEYGLLAAEGPVAYRTQFPVGEWTSELQSMRIPCRVSYHAGTYLCNAAMYLSHHWFASRGIEPRVGFMHLPLTPEQSMDDSTMHASLPTNVTSRAIAMVIDRIIENVLRSPHSSTQTFKIT